MEIMFLSRRLYQGLLVGLVGGFLLAGCDGPSKTATGGALGGIAGGVLGSQVGEGHTKTAATIAGVLVGAALGGAVGNSMDKTDEIYAQRALSTARTDEPVRWRNNDTGGEYTMTPTSQDYNMNNQNCRDYRTVAMIDGVEEVIDGTACQQSDGSWKTIKVQHSTYK
jgi:surface antigen